jgi:hypothetical protein
MLCFFCFGCVKCSGHGGALSSYCNGVVVDFYVRMTLPFETPHKVLSMLFVER